MPLPAEKGPAGDYRASVLAESANRPGPCVSGWRARGVPHLARKLARCSTKSQGNLGDYVAYRAARGPDRRPITCLGAFGRDPPLFPREITREPLVARSKIARSPADSPQLSIASIPRRSTLSSRNLSTTFRHRKGTTHLYNNEKSTGPIETRWCRACAGKDRTEGCYHRGLLPPIVERRFTAASK